MTDLFGVRPSPPKKMDGPRGKALYLSLARTVKEWAESNEVGISVSGTRRKMSVELRITAWNDDSSGRAVWRCVMLWYERAPKLKLPIELIGERFTSEKGETYRVLGIASTRAKKYPILCERLTGAKKGKHFVFPVASIEKAFKLEKGGRSMEVSYRRIADDDDDGDIEFEEMNDERAIDLGE